MSGTVAAIWHLALRSNLFYGNFIFMLLFLSLSGLTIAYSNSLLQGHSSTEPGIIIKFDIFVLIYSVPQTSDRKKKSKIY